MMNRPLEQINLVLSRGNRDFHFRGDSDGDRGVIRQIFEQRDYDLSRFQQHAAVMACYRSLLQAGKKPLILDAGANIGASVVYFSEQFPESRIVAIEPSHDNCELLKKNCAGLDVILLEGGIASENGSMFLHDPGMSDWGFQLRQQGDHAVPVFSANELIEDQVGGGMTPFAFKIDIEGGEVDLFSRHTAWLDAFPLVIIELHDWLLPGQASSRNFLRAISALDFDFVYMGENAFCFNNRLLAS